MIRILLLLLGALRVSGPGHRPPTAWRVTPGGGRDPGDQGTYQAPYRATCQSPFQAAYQGPFQQPPAGPPGDGSAAPRPVPGAGMGPARRPAGPGWPGTPGGQPRPRRRIARWAVWGTVALAAVLVFRRVIASLVLAALATSLHLIGVNAHVPSLRLAWPWQTAQAGTATSTSLGPWVLQKIQGISRPALGRASFDFVFTHRVSQNIGPWPCWYASTFFAVGHASATVDLNPGPAWWAPARGHYRLQVLSRPQPGKPGHIAVTMTLPRPQLPRSAHDVSIDDIPSRPLATQHSWTYPGLGCGVVLHPQFPQSVLYAQAQRIAFYKATHSPQVTHSLIAAAQAQAGQTIRANFIQPTVNALGYTLDRLTLRWVSPGA
jgi:hypothetical protein